MAMSRKHYEAVAEILAKNARFYEGAPDMYGLGKREALVELTWDLAEYFTTENPNFDRQRFLKAAGVN